MKDADGFKSQGISTPPLRPLSALKTTNSSADLQPTKRPLTIRCLVRTLLTSLSLVPATPPSSNGSTASSTGPEEFLDKLAAQQSVSPALPRSLEEFPQSLPQVLGRNSPVISSASPEVPRDDSVAKPLGSPTFPRLPGVFPRLPHRIPSHGDPIISSTALEDSRDEFPVETSVSPITSPVLTRVPKDFPRSPSHIPSGSDPISSVASQESWDESPYLLSSSPQVPSVPESVPQSVLESTDRDLVLSPRVPEESSESTSAHEEVVKPRRNRRHILVTRSRPQQKRSRAFPGTSRPKTSVPPVSPSLRGGPL